MPDAGASRKRQILGSRNRRRFIERRNTCLAVWRSNESR